MPLALAFARPLAQNAVCHLFPHSFLNVLVVIPLLVLS